MRAQIATNPTACIDSKIKLVTDHTHTKIAETVPFRAYFTSAIVSRKLVLTCDISASLVNKDLD
jgi:hypothetical protein